LGDWKDAIPWHIHAHQHDVVHVHTVTDLRREVGGVNTGNFRTG
jgi:hypothetical protein